MSLINDMLRDLEHRRGGRPITGYDALSGVSPAFAPVPAPTPAARSVLLGVCVGFVIAGTAWLVFERYAADDGAGAARLMDVSTAPTVSHTSAVPAASAKSRPAAIEIMTRPGPPPTVDAADKTAAPESPLQTDIEVGETVTVRSVPIAATAEPAGSTVDEPAMPSHDAAPDPAPEVTRPGSIERQQSLAPPPAADRLAAILPRLRDPSDTAARDDLAALVENHPRMAAARAALARDLLRTGHEDRALTTLSDGLALDPADGTLSQLLAHLLVARGETRAALTVLEAGIPSAADRGEYLALAAALYQREARHAAAVDTYREALAVAPGRGAWWIGLAISLAALDDAEGANRAYQRALIDRDLSDRLRAWANRELGRLENRG